MRYRNLPGTDRSASVIVLGCAWFGTDIPEASAFELLDTFRELGGNFLDTAHMYASWVRGGKGQSESTIGKWLRGVERERVLVGTKGADQGMGEPAIRAQLDESLHRLGTDYVDFYWLHVDDPQVPAGDILQWLNRIAEEGHMRAFGCSNWTLARIREADQYARAHGLRGFAASQIGWSLARVNPQLLTGGGQVYMDDETLAFHRQSGMPVVAYSSQAGGFFAGKYDPEGPPPGMTPNPAIVRYYGTPENYARLACAKRLAAAKGCTPNQVALAYLLNQSFPSFAIVGAGKKEYVADSCSASDVALTAEEVQRLESGRPPRA